MPRDGNADEGGLRCPGLETAAGTVKKRRFLTDPGQRDGMTRLNNFTCDAFAGLPGGPAALGR